MSASPSYESAFRPGRLQFVRETTVGVTPADPSWELFSDNIRSFDPSIDPQTGSQRGLDDPDSQGAFAGTEADQIVLTYDLQQKSASGETFVDGSDNPNDAVTDGLRRDADNRILNTHTVVRRKEQSALAAGNTVNGSNSKDTRRYVVAKGGYIDEPTLTGDPSNPQPILVELSYEFEKIRVYQIDQPDASTQLRVVSTDANDTTQTLTIEDEDAGTTEDVSLNGTTVQTTTSSFADIDALSLDAETAGNVEVYVDDSGSNGDQLAEIKGQDAYDHGEGDLGVPALGSGSNASAIGQSYELYHDDLVERPDGTAIAEGLETTEFSVSNNVDGTEQQGTPRRALSAGNREVTVSSTVFGESEHHDHVVEMLTTATDNVRWTVDGGHIQADSADVRSVGAAENVGESKMMSDVEFQGQGLTVA